MLVSIGIPTWNRSHFVMESLRSALGQTYSEIEIVVSDNASTDDTEECIRGFRDPRIRYLRQPSNIGAIRNLDACLQAARGEFFLLLSDDDILEPGAIEALSRPFRRPAASLPAESIGLCWCPCTTIEQTGAPLWITAAGPALETSASLMTALFKGKRGPRLASVLVRTADSRRVGGYDVERYNAFADTTNWGKVALSYPKVVCVPEALVKYRMHGASATSQSQCDDWQHWGSIMFDDLLAVLRTRNDWEGEKLLSGCRRHLLANLTAEVLMRGKGRPGWVEAMLRECWRSREFMLTPYVAARVFREGWKLLKLR